MHIGLFKTRWGLRSRAVSEHPRAAETVGIHVLSVRYRNVILGAVIAGGLYGFLHPIIEIIKNNMYANLFI